MVRESVSLRAPIRLSMEISITDNFKVKVSSILQQVIIIWVSSDSIKRKEEEFIIGLANKVTFIRDSSKQENVMVVELSGGVTEVGMKANLGMESKVVGEYFIGKAEIENTKAIGTMVCLMVKEHNTSKTAKDIKAHSKRTNFTEKAYSIKMTLSYMEFGKIMNFQLSIWLNQVLETNDSSSAYKLIKLFLVLEIL